MTKYNKHNVVIIDNYDSFTYNLVHMVEEILEREIVVMRNDEIDYSELDNSTHLILSPGPGIPDEAGDLKDIIKSYGEKKKIFGKSKIIFLKSKFTSVKDLLHFRGS